MEMTTAIQTTHRPAAHADIPALVELCNQTMVAMWGVAEWSVGDMEEIFAQPTFNSDLYTRLWHDEKGTLVGAGLIRNVQPPAVRVIVMPYIVPDFPESLSLGLAIMEWGESVVRAHTLSLAPDHARVQLQSWTNTTYTPYVTLYQAYGMHLIRQYWTMGMELHEGLAMPTLPDGVAIRPMRYPGESREMYRLSDIAFRDHYGHVADPELNNYEPWATRRLQSQWFDSTLWFVVEVNGEIAGFSFCQAGASDNAKLGFVETLGVLPAFRRQGLATLLLHHSFRTLYERGMEQVELEVDATNITGATRVYTAAGMSPVVVWDSYAKLIRDGVEIGRE